MCEVCVDVARLNNTPYTLSSVVSLPSKSVRELFQTFFDILEDYSFRFQVSGFKVQGRDARPCVSATLVLTIKFLVSCQNQIGV